MVVKTRSYNRQVAAAEAAAEAAEADSAYRSDRRRRVKIVTPSFLDASIRTYKVYSPPRNTKHSSSTYNQDDVDTTTATAAEALFALQNDDSQWEYITTDICLNPMHPITQYIYSMSVYNSDKTVHYRTAYIMYDDTTHLYHVYSIISNCFPGATATTATAATAAATSTSGYSAPFHTVQMKFTSFSSDAIVNYIMTLIVPSNEYGYFIQDDIIGIVASKEEFAQTAFSPDSSYYDINHLFTDNTSRDTVYGSKAFHLIPSRTYWCLPSDTATYTESVVNSVIFILSRMIS